MARVPTQQELEAIAEMKSKGLSDTKVAEALSISRSTFAKWKRLPREGDDCTIHTQVTQSIKMGMEQRLDRHLALAIDAVDLLLKYREWEEVKTKYERQLNPRTEEYEMIAIEETRTPKHADPNPMMVIFTLVNRNPDDFQSINKPREVDVSSFPPGMELETD